MKPTRRGFLSTIVAVPLAGWSGFWRKTVVKPLIKRSIKRYPGNIYLEDMAKRHAVDIERAYLGIGERAGEALANFKAREGYRVMMHAGEGQDDIVLGEVVKNEQAQDT